MTLSDMIFLPLVLRSFGLTCCLVLLKLFPIGKAGSGQPETAQRDSSETCQYYCLIEEPFAVRHCRAGHHFSHRMVANEPLLPGTLNAASSKAFTITCPCSQLNQSFGSSGRSSRLLMQFLSRELPARKFGDG